MTDKTIIFVRHIASDFKLKNFDFKFVRPKKPFNTKYQKNWSYKVFSAYLLKNIELVNMIYSCSYKYLIFLENIHMRITILF